MEMSNKIIMSQRTKSCDKIGYLPDPPHNQEVRLLQCLLVLERKGPRENDFPLKTMDHSNFKIRPHKPEEAVFHHDNFNS